MARQDELFGQIIRAMIHDEVEAALDARGLQSGDDREGGSERSRPAKAKNPPPDLDPYALVPFAEYVLRQAGGGPLHVRVMAEEMYALGFRHRRPPKYRDQLLRSLNALPSPTQYPTIFRRVKPRTLELVRRPRSRKRPR